MQPVTIKSNQYSNTLWLVQFGFCLMAITVVWLGIKSHLWVLLLIPIIMLSLYRNQKIIEQQSKLTFAMRPNGQLVLIEGSSSEQTYKNQTARTNDEMTAVIRAFWQTPQVLMLKIKLYGHKTPVFLSLFRSVLGAQDFSMMVVGVTQLNSTQTEQL